MAEPRCPPGISLSLGMPDMAVPILIITGPVAVSVRLLPFHGLGCLRYLRNLRDSLEVAGALVAVVAAVLFHVSYRRVYPVSRRRSN